MAQQLVPTVTGVPVGINIGVSLNGFTTLTIMATIYTDAGGGVPGTFLTTTVPMPVNNPPVYPETVQVRMRFLVPSPTLTAGMSYVVVFECPSNACFVVVNSTNACTGVALQSLDFGGTWTNLSADVCHKLIGR